MTENKTQQNPDKWSKIGLIIASIALLVALIPAAVDFLSSPPEPVETKQAIGEIVSTIKGIASGEVEGYQKPPSSQTISSKARPASLILAVIAFLLTILAYVNHENKRTMQASALVSAIVVGYYFLWVVLGLIVFAIILYYCKDLFLES